MLPIILMGIGIAGFIITIIITAWQVSPTLALLITFAIITFIGLSLIAYEKYENDEDFKEWEERYK